MAVGGPSAAPLPRRVPVSLFVRMKLRVLGNAFRGRTARVLLFVGGVLLAAYLAGIGFLLFAVSTAGDAQVRLMVASFGGAALVLGAVLLPLIWFGVDDTLDPARFALLPLSRGRLVAGLFAAALVSVPALAVLVATAGLLVPVGDHGGLPALAVQAVGLVAGLLLCVAVARAVTSAFASMLRSRRVRDLAGILLACLAALIAPIQLAIGSAAQRADWDQLGQAAAIVGWTPFGAPYTVGIDVAQGRPLAAAAKLLIVAATIAGLLWWWSRTLESALLGAAGGGRPARAVASGARGSAVSQLFPRVVPGLPASPFGAIVARELRYWWRDAKRRANLITVAVIAVLAPLVVAAGGVSLAFQTGSGDEGGASLGGGGSPGAINITVVFVGAFAASVLANQFGFDGSAYAAHLTAGVPGRRELRARATAHALLMAPLLLLVGAVVAGVAGDPALAPGAWGMVAAGYGTGVAVNQYLSVLAPYALPEGSNPFATASGTGLAKSLLALLAILIAYAITVPVLMTAGLLGAVWPWLAVPVGVGYGLAAVALGTYLAGDVLDHRAPRVLAAITPSRSP